MTICLIRTAHFLDIFDVREMPLLGSHSLIHATKRGVFGGFKRLVKFLAGRVLVFLMTKTGIQRSQKQLFSTSFFSQISEHTTPNNSHVPKEFVVSGLRITPFAKTFKLLLQHFQLLVG